MSNKNEQKTFTVISLQSAKGGVGKTTIAINIARSIKKIKSDPKTEDSKKVRVYIFDLDMTGTSIEDIYKQKNDNSTSGTASREGHFCLKPLNMKTSKTKTANFVKLYSKYLDGSRIHELIDLPDTHNIDTAFYISSGMLANKAMEQYWMIYEPLHSEWFGHFLLELMEDIVEKEEQKRKKLSLNTDEYEYFFILDNSSGWSKLRLSIEEFFIEKYISCENINLKMLYVATPDKMDIKSTTDDIARTYRNYSAKRTELCQQDALNKESEIRIPSGCEGIGGVDSIAKLDNISLDSLNPGASPNKKEKTFCRLILNKGHNDNRSEVIKMLDKFAIQIVQKEKDISEAIKKKNKKALLDWLKTCIISSIIIIPYNIALFTLYRKPGIPQISPVRGSQTSTTSRDQSGSRQFYLDTHYNQDKAILKLIFSSPNTWEPYRIIPDYYLPVILHLPRTLFFVFTLMNEIIAFIDKDRKLKDSILECRFLQSHN